MTDNLQTLKELSVKVNELALSYRYREALQLSDRLLEEGGPNKEHLFFRAIWLHKVGKNKEALEAVKESIALGVKNISTNALYAKLCLANKKFDECIGVCEQYFHESPKEFGLLKSEALVRIGNNKQALDYTFSLIQKEECQTVEIIELFLNLASKPIDGLNYIIAAAKTLTRKYQMFNAWGNAELWYQDALKKSHLKVLEGKNPKAAASKVMSSLYLLKDDEHEELMRWHHLSANALIEQKEIKIQPYRHDKLRVGFVSSDLRRHSVAYFAKAIYEYADKSKYDIYTYYTKEDPDEITTFFEAKSSVFYFAGTMPDVDLYRQIKADEIDILVDLNGWTSGNRLKVFSQRAAPIQLTYLGYPSTTAIKNIDYRIVDEITDPYTSHEQYTENLVRLDRLFIAYTPPPELPTITRKSDANAIVFGCFNTLNKINTDLINMWSELLCTIENSRLILKSKGTDSLMVRARIEKMFEERGVAKNRVEFINTDRTLASHLEQYNKVDIALDTYPYSGTTTTCEALYMGVPTVTIIGQSHRSRVSYAILKTIGLEELCFRAEGFIEGVSQLCGDNERLNKIKSELRGRVSSSSLSDGKGFAEEWFSLISKLSMSVIDDEEKQTTRSARGGGSDDSVSR